MLSANERLRICSINLLLCCYINVLMHAPFETDYDVNRMYRGNSLTYKLSIRKAEVIDGRREKTN